MTCTGRLTAGGAFALTSLLSRALAQGTCGEVVWEQKFESPTIDELLQEADGEAFYPVGDPPGCALAVCNLLCMKLAVTSTPNVICAVHLALPLSEPCRHAT